MLELGMKPRYNKSDIWQIHLSTLNDGFKSSRNVSECFVDGPMYRLAVEDFSVVMAGRNGKFQWVGVSAVA
jgi:DNA polymerase I